MGSKYKEGDVVWLKPFEGQPREKCRILAVTEMKWGLSYVGTVTALADGDDGLREFDGDQIKSHA